MTYCEDCGDETFTRRHRCFDCGQLVCAWCSGHVHRCRRSTVHKCKLRNIATPANRLFVVPKPKGEKPE